MFRNTGVVSYREKFELAQDYDFYLQALSHGLRMANIPSILLRYRENPSSLTSNHRLRQLYFEEAARLFFRQRGETGSDNYASFDPSAVPHTELLQRFNVEFERARIHDLLNRGQGASARQAIRQFGRIHRQPRSLSIWYALSYLSHANYLRARRLIQVGRWLLAT
jgi:hypothetical protein